MTTLTLESQFPPPDFEDEATLYSLASEFLKAAFVLSQTLATRLNVSVVTYYLVGHAAELLLKSYLYKRGVTLDDLKNRYGHHIERLVERSRQEGLSSTVSTKDIERFAAAYARKGTEYRQRREFDFPPLDDLLGETKALQSIVFDHVADFEAVPK